MCRRAAPLSSLSTGVNSQLPPPLIDYDLDRNSDTYQEAMKRTETQVDELNERLGMVQQGGGEKAVQRHLDRNKELPRDRIHRLVDPGTAVMELSALAGNENDIPSAGIVTAIGIVHGVPVMMIANDATVKG